MKYMRITGKLLVVFTAATAIVLMGMTVAALLTGITLL